MLLLLKGLKLAELDQADWLLEQGDLYKTGIAMLIP
jgi:hypothetical protein